MVGSIDGSPRGSDGVLGPQGTGGVNETTQSTSQSYYTGGVPDASSKDDLNTLLSGPTLEAPDSQFSQMSFPELSALCTEAILSMLGFEERKSAVDSGINAIETHRQQRAEVNQERIENLQEQAKKAEDNSLLSKIKEAFSYIGMALGALAGIGSFILGCCTGNPLLIAGGLMLTLSTAEQIMSTASDGKISLQGLGEYIIDKHGGNKEACMYTCMAITMAIGLIGAGLTAGGASGATLAKLSTNAQQITAAFQTASNIMNAGNSIVTGSVNIAYAVNSAQLQNIKAEGLDIEAILQRIAVAMELDTEQIKKILEKSNDMAEGVKQILNDCNKTVGAVLTGAPAMA